MLLRKAIARARLQSAMLDMLAVLREEIGNHVDGVAADLTIHDNGDSSGNLAALVGDIEIAGEVL